MIRMFYERCLPMFHRNHFVIQILILCFCILLIGCPKKSVMKEELTEESERIAQLEEELALRERELKAKEEEAKRALAEKERRAKEEEERRALAEKELAAEKERAARLEAEQTLREKEFKAKEEETKRALAEIERRAKEEEERRALAEKREFEKSLMAKKHPGIEGEVFESKLLKDIHFDFDKYDIRSGDTEILKENAELLMKFTNVKIQIEGHCDERGTAEYNLALGERRANSVKKYLISLGIPPDRISTISYGEERPLDPGHNEEAWAKNRRAHFIILSK